MSAERYLRHIAERDPSLPARMLTDALATIAMATGKYDVTGADNIPTEGPVILAANHISEFDPVIFNAWVHRRGRRQPTIFAKQALFTPPVAGHYMRAIHAIPVLRGKAGANIPYFDAGLRVLDRGGAVVVYPEGTSAGGEGLWPKRGKPGIGYLALNSGAPVVPIAQWGAQAFMNRDSDGNRHVSFWPLPKPISLNIGESLQFPASETAFDDTESNQAVSDAVMRAITDQLSELRDEAPRGYYAPKV